MKANDPDLVDRLAAEYVLGTLRGGARRRFERWLLSPQVRGMVTDWEERLAGLEPPLDKVTPPGAVWRGIESRLELRQARRAPAVRWLAVAASVLLFGLLGMFAWNEWIAAPEPTQVAVVATEDAQTIYWRVELLGDNQELRVQAQSPHAVDAGKALELWILPASGNPVSLGLLPASGEHRHALTAAQRAALVGAKQLAVSIEPTGGSPTGLPTGDVIHVAPLTPA